MNEKERFKAGEMFVISGKVGGYYFQDGVIFRETFGADKCEGSCTIRETDFICETSMLGVHYRITTLFSELDFESLL